jgi:hypothetical protein
VAKEIGVDAHHVGDAGYHGVGDPHLLHAYSLAVRGRRHTWRRMALSARCSNRCAWSRSISSGDPVAAGTEPR